jgi:hypothetical protein
MPTSVRRANKDRAVRRYPLAKKGDSTCSFRSNPADLFVSAVGSARVFRVRWACAYHSVVLARRTDVSQEHEREVYMNDMEPRQGGSS